MSAKLLQKFLNKVPSLKKEAPDKESEKSDTVEVMEKTDQDSQTKPTIYQRLFGSRVKKISWGIFVVLILILTAVGVAGFYTYSVAMEIKGQATELQTVGMNAYTNFKNQNLPAAESELKNTKEKLMNIKSTYGKLGFYKNVPIAKAYYQDGQHGLNAAEAGLDAGLKTIAAIAPYADVLGFSGEGSFEGGSAENRIKLILDTLEKVTPILDEIQADLNQVNSELAMIDESRYPTEIREIKVQEQIKTGKEMANQASVLLSDYRPIIELIPDIAGSKEERRKYLVLFQNDNELRPTGGFLTAYSVIYIEDGKVTPEKSDDIYELDQKFNERIEIPEALEKYLTTEKYFNLRDMNIHPDFKLSMDLFFENYQNVPGEPDNIDGIIAVDTQLLTDLMKIVGPIDIPGYGTFTAENDERCDCPQIIYALSEIITRPTPYMREDRKGILGPLMQSILQKIYSSPRTYMAQLFDVALKDIEGRHVQMYFVDEEFQQAVESINAAGRMSDNDEAKDFLAIINANLGGAKSNLFVDYEVTQLVEEAPVDGRLTKTVEITYKNDHKADNCNLEAGLLCLNSTLRDWTRLYIPAGSELVQAQGFTADPQVYEENGFSVIDGFFILEPMAQAKLKITYTIPYEGEMDEYSVALWKQGGISPIPVLMDITGGQELVEMSKDMVYRVEF